MSPGVERGEGVPSPWVTYTTAIPRIQFSQLNRKSPSITLHLVPKCLSELKGCGNLGPVSDID